MFMSDQKKKPSTLIVASMKPSAPMEQAPKNENGDETDSSIGLESAAQDVLSAIEAKDAKQLASAMKALVEMCDDDSSEASEDAPADEAS